MRSAKLLKLFFLTLLALSVALIAAYSFSAEPPDLQTIIKIIEAEQAAQATAVAKTADPAPAANPTGEPAPVVIKAADHIPDITKMVADAQPTPMESIGTALRALNLRGKTFLDIGCGFDCRAGIVAVRDFGAARVIAIEIDPATADSARRYVAHAGLSDKIQVLTADAAAVEFPAGAVGFAYLWPEALTALRPKLEKLAGFASFSHAVPGLPMRRSGDVYVYQRPTARSVMEQVRASRPVATYGGRKYTAPVCNSRNCSMCAAIRAQLGY